MLKLASKAILFNTKPINIQIKKLISLKVQPYFLYSVFTNVFPGFFLSGGANLQD